MSSLVGHEGSSNTTLHHPYGKRTFLASHIFHGLKQPTQCLFSPMEATRGKGNVLLTPPQGSDSDRAGLGVGIVRS